MPRGEQLHRPAVVNFVGLEGDPLVARSDWTLSELAQPRRDVGDLEASSLALGHPAAETGKRLTKGPLDVVRLQAAGTRLVHLRAKLGDVGFEQRVASQRVLIEQLGDPLGDTLVDYFLHSFLDLRLLAIPDRFEQ